jgi:hypothetical protein
MGWDLTAQMFDGTSKSVGFLIPTTYLNGGSEGSQAQHPLPEASIFPDICKSLLEQDQYSF